MKKLQLLLLLSLACTILTPVDAVYAKEDGVTSDAVSKPHQDIVPDTVKDPHSKYTAKFKMKDGRVCTAILISSTAALTARHCVGNTRKTNVGTIYPGASGSSTPFGYMNISEYIPNPDLDPFKKYDIAILKGTERDQDKFYKYYIKKFKTSLRGYTDDQFKKFVGKEVYSYGYPYKGSDFYQYRSDGSITSYIETFKYLYTDMPAFVGQSGSGVFTKNGDFIGLIIESTTQKHEAVVLPFTQEIADWVNKNAN
ncbi:trypsin-like peptidase domain-containing protein [Staphylococcus ursi]|uniref:trypsin-like serine peptidase n=1 Tax=Staphylococcus sp. MI 10-1553 TaxID=1912064 RepID=UPI0013978A47|nr:serine protease [Staphylococcus sp. MI 10-1553]QHW37989.1 trypsin-like peptidase domain-containing protein [Staphylococcus sp. MI 10-1553]